MESGALFSDLSLSSGHVLRNRIVKAATSEKLAARDGAPNASLIRLYRRWAEGGAGLLITGNVIIDPGGCEGPGNVIIEDDRHLDLLRRWAQEAQISGTKLVMQISHAGRQSPRSVTRQPLAPSAVPLRGVAGIAAKPKALTDDEIERLIARFARTAFIADQAGFAGVQLHGAHGYLISQFLSPHTNRRTDRWGGSLDNRLRFLLRAIAAVRAATRPGFSISVKLNSADFQRGGFTREESMRVATILDGEGIDFLEISGGSYESTAMFSGARKARASTRAREAYFSDYAAEVRDRVKLPLMLTGGFRSREGMEAALSDGAVDLVGLARPLIAQPDLPERMRRGEADRAVDVDLSARPVQLSNLLLASWYGRQLRRMGAGEAPDLDLGRWRSLVTEGLPTYAFNPLTALWPRARPTVATPPALGGER